MYFAFLRWLNPPVPFLPILDVFHVYIFELKVEQCVLPSAVRQLEVLAMPESFAVACLKIKSANSLQ